jgi:hypothetical protein
MKKTETLNRFSVFLHQGPLFFSSTALLCKAFAQKPVLEPFSAFAEAPNDRN